MNVKTTNYECKKEEDKILVDLERNVSRYSMLSGEECVVNAVQCSHPAVHENSEQVCKYSTHLAIRILFHILIDTIQLCGNYKYKPSYNLMIKSCSFSLEVFFLAFFLATH